MLEVMSMNVISVTGTGISLDGEAFQTGKLIIFQEDKEKVIQARK